MGTYLPIRKKSDGSKEIIKLPYSIIADPPVDYIKITISGNSGTLSSSELEAIKANPHKVVINRGTIWYYAENLSDTTYFYTSQNVIYNGNEIQKHVLSINPTSGTWSYQLYKYTPTFTDTKVTQSNTTTDKWRKIVLGSQEDEADAAVSEQTNQVYVTSNIEVQPSTGTLKALEIITDTIEARDEELQVFGKKRLYLSATGEEGLLQLSSVDMEVHGTDSILMGVDNYSASITLTTLDPDGDGTVDSNRITLSAEDIVINKGENNFTFPNSSGTLATIVMPIIRLGNVSDIDGTMVITESNPLKFSVEVIGGELQVGDELQLCSRRLYTYVNDTKDGRIKRYKLRQFVKHTITEEDLTKRYISISVAHNVEIKELLRGGGKPNSTVNNYYTKYLRIRRTHPNNPNNALFSNAVPFQVFGRHDKVNDSSLGVVTIR